MKSLKVVGCAVCVLFIVAALGLTWYSNKLERHPLPWEVGSAPTENGWGAALAACNKALALDPSYHPARFYCAFVLGRMVSKWQSPQDRAHWKALRPVYDNLLVRHPEPREAWIRETWVNRTYLAGILGATPTNQPPAPERRWPHVRATGVRFGCIATFQAHRFP